MSPRKERVRNQDRVAGIAGLREVIPPPSFVPGVMRKIAEPAPLSFWGWLRKRRRIELRLAVSPLGAVAFAFAAVALLVGVVGGWQGAPGPRLFSSLPPAAVTTETPARLDIPQAGDPRTPQETILVRFVLVAQGAKQVTLAGDFNDWNPQQTPLLKQDGSGTFAATVQLSRGAHQYMFIVDGRWVTDPTASERLPDGFGRENAILRL